MREALVRPQPVWPISLALAAGASEVVAWTCRIRADRRHSLAEEERRRALLAGALGVQTDALLYCEPERGTEDRFGALEFHDVFRMFRSGRRRRLHCAASICSSSRASWSRCSGPPAQG